MAAVAQSKVSLRISGDDLDPDDISRRLGAAPTRTRTKGQRASWHLEASERRPEDINGQVASLLAQLTPDLAVWATVTAVCKVDMFCGLFLDTSNEGFSLSPDIMSALASRGIEIGFDIYDKTA